MKTLKNIQKTTKIVFIKLVENFMKEIKFSNNINNGMVISELQFN